MDFAVPVGHIGWARANPVVRWFADIEAGRRMPEPSFSASELEPFAARGYRFVVLAGLHEDRYPAGFDALTDMLGPPLVAAGEQAAWRLPEPQSALTQPPSVLAPATSAN